MRAGEESAPEQGEAAADEGDRLKSRGRHVEVAVVRIQRDLFRCLGARGELHLVRLPGRVGVAGWRELHAVRLGAVASQLTLAWKRGGGKGRSDRHCIRRKSSRRQWRESHGRIGSRCAGPLGGDLDGEGTKGEGKEREGEER